MPVQIQVVRPYLCGLFTLSINWNHNLESLEIYNFFSSINWRNANYSDEIFHKLILLVKTHTKKKPCQISDKLNLPKKVWKLHVNYLALGKIHTLYGHDVLFYCSPFKIGAGVYISTDSQLDIQCIGSHLLSTKDSSESLGFKSYSKPSGAAWFYCNRKKK